jgi:hypothetical protein
MSAFVVSEETINSVVNWFSTRNGANYKDWFARETGINMENLQALGEACLALNVTAVNYRYKENDPAPDYHHTWNLCKLEQHYKSLCCLLYQSGQEVNETAPLYKALVDLKQIIADDIISRLPEYEAAKWD